MKYICIQQLTLGLQYRKRKNSKKAVPLSNMQTKFVTERVKVTSIVSNVLRVKKKCIFKKQQRLIYRFPLFLHMQVRRLSGTKVYGRKPKINKTQVLILRTIIQILFLNRHGKFAALVTGGLISIFHGLHLIIHYLLHYRNHSGLEQSAFGQKLLCNEHSQSVCLCPVTLSQQVKNGSCKVIQCLQRRHGFSVNYCWWLEIQPL